MADVLKRFRIHPESKSAAPEGTPPGAEAIGLLRRLDVRAFTIEHIGKETNLLEQQQEGICFTDPQAVYTEPRTRAQLRARLDRVSISKLSVWSGVSERMLRDLRRGTREGSAKTWRAVSAALVAMLDEAGSRGQGSRTARSGPPPPA